MTIDCSWLEFIFLLETMRLKEESGCESHEPITFFAA